MHYNAGYLAAVTAGTFAIRGVMQRTPPCPHAHESQAALSWWAGVIDAATDTFEAAAKPRP